MRHRATTLLFATLTAVTLSLTGCATKTGTGAAIGAGAGTATGYMIGGTGGAIVGGLLGTAIGAGIGYQLDVEDQRRAARVLETAPTHHTETWVNPDTGARYEMTPVETYRSDAGQPCREYSFTAFIGGRPEETHGTACREADGSWRVVG